MAWNDSAVGWVKVLVVGRGCFWVAEELFLRVGLTFQNHDDWTLIEYVEDVKKRLMPLTVRRQ